MTAYYNEIDPYAAQWLRNLIAAGHIAPGDVDERSIEDVKPDDLAGYTQCHFFAGIGVWSYSLRKAGWPDTRPVWTGSCPCQPFSAAGKRGGLTDSRHLWPTWSRLIAARQPVVVFGEQVASKDGLAWLDIVHADLEAADYAVRAVDLCAAGVGAPHIRQRLWFVADHGGGRSQLANPVSARWSEGRAVAGCGPAAGSGALGVVADAGVSRRQQIRGSTSCDEAANGRQPNSDNVTAGDVATGRVANTELSGGGRVLSIEQTISQRSKSGRKVQVGLENVAQLAGPLPTPVTPKPATQTPPTVSNQVCQERQEGRYPDG